MAKKCDICGQKIETIFLGKLIGTQVKNKFVCSKCQSTHKGNLKKKLGIED